MSKKVIFLDIDGTLTSPGTNIPAESAIRAVKATRAKGNYVYLCTGRNYDMMKPMLQYGFDGVVASAGGYVECAGEVIYECHMTEAQKEKVLRVLKEKGINRTLECKDGTYSDDDFRKMVFRKYGENESSELLRWRKQLEQELNIRPMEEYDGKPIYKVTIMGDDPVKMQEAQELLGDEFEFCFQDFSNMGMMNGELINRAFNKGEAVKRVCQHLGIPLEDSIAFGDSMNDKQMLEVAGIGICMGNGNEKLKELADDVCPAVNEDGIYCAFEKYGLL
jgi:hypothetical protein